MFHTAVVPVNRHPVIKSFFGRKRFAVMRVQIAQEIPGRTGPLRHGVRLPLRRSRRSSDRWCSPNLPFLPRAIPRCPSVHSCRFPARSAEGHCSVQRHPSAFVAPNQRNWLAPVALAGKHPVAQLIVDFFLTDSFFFKICNHVGNGGSSTSMPSRNPEFTIFPLAGCCVCFLLNILAAGDNFDNWHIKFLRKLPVTRCRAPELP